MHGLKMLIFSALKMMYHLSNTNMTEVLVQSVDNYLLLMHDFNLELERTDILHWNNTETNKLLQEDKSNVILLLFTSIGTNVNIDSQRRQDLQQL